MFRRRKEPQVRPIVASIKPGDMIIFEADHAVSQATFNRLREGIQAEHPGTTVLVVERMRFSALLQGSDD